MSSYGLFHHSLISTGGAASPAPPLSFPSWNSRLTFLVHTQTTSYSFPLHAGVPVSKGTGVVSMWRSAT